VRSGKKPVAGQKEEMMMVRGRAIAGAGEAYWVGSPMVGTLRFKRRHFFAHQCRRVRQVSTSIEKSLALARSHLVVCHGEETLRNINSFSETPNCLGCGSAMIFRRELPR